MRLSDYKYVLGHPPVTGLSEGTAMGTQPKQRFLPLCSVQSVRVGSREIQHSDEFIIKNYKLFVG